MLYWLIDLSDKLTVLNVFRYITFRTGGAVITALLFVFLFGTSIIDRLRALQGKGQPIRTDGPQSHIIAKAGTPTMGGLMILSGMLVSTLLWANPSNPYVWIVLGVTLGFGLVGFYDDYLKVTKQTHKGFPGLARLAIEAAIAAAACVAFVHLGRAPFSTSFCSRPRLRRASSPRKASATGSFWRTGSGATTSRESMEPLDYDILTVGAGPAGLAAATAPGRRV